MGTLLIDITLALAGASAVKVAKYLSKTGRGSRILNVLNKYKKPAVKLENKAPLPGKTGAYHTTLICKTFNETSNLNKLAIKNISYYQDDIASQGIVFPEIMGPQSCVLSRQNLFFFIDKRSRIV